MWTYTQIKPLLFALFFFGAMGVFTRSVWRLVRLVRLGKEAPHSHFKDPVDRIGDLIMIGFGHKRVVKEKFGWNHVLFFWAFVIIVIGHVEFILRGILPSFSLHFLGDTLHGWIVRGGDLMAFFVLFAVAAALIRRVIVKPWY